MRASHISGTVVAAALLCPRRRTQPASARDVLRQQRRPARRRRARAALTAPRRSRRRSRRGSRHDGRRDTILLAAGTFTDQSGADFVFDSGSGHSANDLTIQGAGVGQTTTHTVSASTARSIIGLRTGREPVRGSAILQDLTISMPPGFISSGVFEPTELPTA